MPPFSTVNRCRRRRAHYAPGRGPRGRHVPRERPRRAVARRGRPRARADVDCRAGRQHRHRKPVENGPSPCLAHRIGRWPDRRCSGHGACWHAPNRLGPAIFSAIRTLVSVAPAEQLRTFPMDQTDGEGRPGRPAMAASPDGQFLVFSAVRGGQQQLYVRPLTNLEGNAHRWDRRRAQPVFSPDGRWLGFSVGGAPASPAICSRWHFQARDLYKKLAPRSTTAVFGASWGSDDTIVFAERTGGLWRIPASGGNASPDDPGCDARRVQPSPPLLPARQSGGDVHGHVCAESALERDGYCRAITDDGRAAATPLPAWLPMYRRPPPYGGGMDVVRQFASATCAQALSSWALPPGTPVTDIRIG